MNLSLRYSFLVPDITAKGKLSGYTLVHTTVCNAVDADDFYKEPVFQAEFKGDVNRLAETWKVSQLRKLAAQRKLTEEQAKLVRFTGLSVCRNEPQTTVPANSPCWV